MINHIACHRNKRCNAINSKISHTSWLFFCSTLDCKYRFLKCCFSNAPPLITQKYKNPHMIPHARSSSQARIVVNDIFEYYAKVTNKKKTYKRYENEHKKIPKEKL